MILIDESCQIWILSLYTMDFLSSDKDVDEYNFIR